MRGRNGRYCAGKGEGGGKDACGEGGRVKFGTRWKRSVGVGMEIRGDEEVWVERWREWIDC